MCGLAAFVGNKENYSPQILKLIMLYQDLRGGDGCGIGVSFKDFKSEFLIKKTSVPPKMHVFKDLENFYRDQEEYQSTFLSWFSKTNVLNFDTDKEIGGIICHARKATIGKLNKLASHPFHITKEEKEIILIHNGTITNYLSLWNTYIKEGYPISDSHTAAMMVSKGLLQELFENMYGSATLIWIEKEDPNTLHICCTGIKTKVDRDLHYLRFDKSYYISSEGTPLKVAKGLLMSPETRDLLGDVVIFEPNIHYKINENGIEEVEFIHKKDIAPIQSNEILRVKGLDSVCKFTPIRYLEGDVIFSNFRYFNAHTLEPLNTGYIFINKDKIKVTDTYLFDSLGHILIKDEKNFFTIIGEEKSTINPKVIYELYFINGILMKDKSSWEELIKRYSNPYNIAPIYLAEYSKYPVLLDMNKSKKDITSGIFFFGKIGAQNLIRESFIPIFTKSVYKFVNSYLVDSMPVKIKVRSSNWKVLQYESKSATR